MDHLKNKKVKDAFFGAQIFYFSFTLMVYIILIKFKTPVSVQLWDGDPTQLICSLILISITVYSYLTTGRNPGYLPKNEETDCEANSNRPKKNSLLYNEFVEEKAVELTDPEQQERPNSLQNEEAKQGGKGLEEKNEPVEIKEQLEIVEHEPQSSLNQLPKRHFCNTCKITQPYRSKHCSHCGLCVRKFDHHCFWIGACVGELNHRKFWIFLFLQTVVSSWAFLMSYQGLDNYEYESPSPHNPKENIYSVEYGALVTSMAFAVCFVMFTGLLLLYHTFLIFTNQTTWEHSGQDTLDFIKVYPKGYLPFSRGLKENLKMVFCHEGRIREWDLPSLEEARNDKTYFNWCDNQYWSCC